MHGEYVLVDWCYSSYALVHHSSGGSKVIREMVDLGTTTSAHQKRLDIFVVCDDAVVDADKF